jgi:hypothetical protein
VGINRGVTGGACHIFTISEWYMLACLPVVPPLGESKIDYVHHFLIVLPGGSQHEVVWLDIAV